MCIRDRVEEDTDDAEDSSDDADSINLDNEIELDAITTSAEEYIICLLYTSRCV